MKLLNIADNHLAPRVCGLIAAGLVLLICMLSAPAPVWAARVAGNAAAATIAQCNWDRPGVNPYSGDVAGAVDRYTDIPASVRERLKERMRAHKYDEFVTISRSSISGREQYDPVISQMHFGKGTVCSKVSRAGWSEQMTERGLVYCEQDVCLLVPTVCNNVSRITRLVGATPARNAGAAAAPALASPAAAAGDIVAAPGEAALGAPPPDGYHYGAAAGPGSDVSWGSSGFGGMTSGPGNTGGGGPATTASSITTGGGGGSGGSIPGDNVVQVPNLPDIGANQPAPPSEPAVMAPVPEPETWAMLLAGLAMLLVAARRARRRQK